jgi:hypothetical protein
VNYSDLLADAYNEHAQGFGATVYSARCDIVEIVNTPDGGGLNVQSLNVIQTGVACQIMPTSQQTVNGDMSATVENEYTLYLLNTVQLKNTYAFTNFIDSNLIEPNALYKTVMGFERFLITSGAGGYVYHIRGIKRINKNG